MQIAADILLVVLALVTVLTTLAFRDTKRVHGPDVMGPAFFFVVSLGVRWVQFMSGGTIVRWCPPRRRPIRREK